MFQRVGSAAYKPDLTNTVKLCEALGNPHQKFKTIHIAGTNGKGSTSHMLAAILQTAGYKTGLYTSPHLKEFTERIRIDGKEIKIEYINFETWRGSGDNVLNFGDVIPKNKCGFIETDNSFHLIHKGGEIKTGELLKSSFDQTLDGYSAYYIVNGENKDKNVTMQWNCAMVITEMNEKTVKGKLIMCFKDDAKNRIAGSFEAIRCNN